MNMSKRYSDLIIIDENEDENMEKLADENNFRYSQYLGFVKELPKNFEKQENRNGYEEWIAIKFYPNHCINCVAPIVITVCAFEFANGFMLFKERDSFYD